MADVLSEEEQKQAEFFMAMAVEEARKGEGETKPNPCVGVVIVKNGKVVGRGFHLKAGGPHAEVFALQAAGDAARGADLYSTLEPCDHTGRTPPCTKAIIRAGISRVFVGSTDVNPIVSGRGCQRLRDNGIQVYTDILKETCDRLNGPFFKFVTRHRPFVTLKIAATADGMIATHSGHSKWITCAESRERVHDLRHRVDAILVGSETLRSDNPELTARPSHISSRRQPLRVVLTSHPQNLPLNAKLFETASKDTPVLVMTSFSDTENSRFTTTNFTTTNLTSSPHFIETSGSPNSQIFSPDRSTPSDSQASDSQASDSQASDSQASDQPNSPDQRTSTVQNCQARQILQTLRSKGVEIECIAADADGRVNLSDVLDALGRRNVMHLLVEGGATIFGNFVNQNLFDRILLFQAPKVLGPGISWAKMTSKDEISAATVLHLESVEPSGQDVLLSYGPNQPASAKSYSKLSSR